MDKQPDILNRLSRSNPFRIATPHQTMRVSLNFLLVFLCTISSGLGVAAGDSFDESPEDFDRRMAWWRDATFGMFIPRIFHFILRKFA